MQPGPGRDGPGANLERSSASERWGSCAAGASDRPRLAAGWVRAAASGGETTGLGWGLRQRNGLWVIGERPRCKRDSVETSSKWCWV